MEDVFLTKYFVGVKCATCVPLYTAGEVIFFFAETSGCGCYQYVKYTLFYCLIHCKLVLTADNILMPFQDTLSQLLQLQVAFLFLVVLLLFTLSLLKLLYVHTSLLEVFSRVLSECRTVYSSVPGSANL